LQGEWVEEASPLVGAAGGSSGAVSGGGRVVGGGGGVASGKDEGHEAWKNGCCC
jgi:hypothetical protein